MQRLNKEALKILEDAFTKKANWDKKEVSEIAKKLGLKSRKVYKWNWDRKKIALKCE